MTASGGRNIALVLRFEGERYHGWQRQKNAMSVCQAVEECLTKVTAGPVHLLGCGRTDAGVHALRYVANFRTESAIPADRLMLAANHLLPGDIAIIDAWDAEWDFHAINTLERKEYTYLIRNLPLREPLLSGRVLEYPLPLDVARMDLAAGHLAGRHDFAAFRTQGSPVRSTVREVYYCEVRRHEGFVSVRVCADGFLYNMVRTIVGTLLYVSQGKLQPEDMPSLLSGADRTAAGPNAPPQGLYMTALWYPGRVLASHDMGLGGCPPGDVWGEVLPHDPNRG